MIRKLLIAAAGLALTGCVNLSYHFGERYDNDSLVYRATCESSYAVAQIFVTKPEWHGGSHGEASYAHAACVLLSPFLLVDWPFEVVADTLTFPYDYFMEDAQ